MKRKQCDVVMADDANPRDIVPCRHYTCSLCGHDFTMSHEWYVVQDWCSDRREYRRAFYCVGCQKTVVKSVATGWYVQCKNAVLTAPQEDGGGGGGSGGGGADQMGFTQTSEFAMDES